MVGATTTNYLWDTNNDLPQLALEQDGANNLLRRYSYGLHRIALATPTANYYYHYDGRDNVANLTSATGASEWTYSYEPFGNATATQNDANAPTNPIQFAGEYQDTATGTYNLRARQYDPSSGRFLSSDPLDPAISDPYSSAYAYADENPLTGTDPSGMLPCLLGHRICDLGHRLDEIGWGIVKAAAYPFADCISHLSSLGLRTANRH